MAGRVSRAKQPPLPESARQTQATPAAQTALLPVGGFSGQRYLDVGLLYQFLCLLGVTAHVPFVSPLRRDELFKGFLREPLRGRETGVAIRAHVARRLVLRIGRTRNQHQCARDACNE